MRGEISLTLQTVFVIIVVMTVLVFLVSEVAKPVYETYGDVQARILAKSLAVAINSLTVVDRGSITKKLDAVWDIETRCDTNNLCFLKVSHDKFSSGDIVIVGKVKPVKLENVALISLIKTNPDEPVEIREV
ncbi:MAG: hypothetical protein DRP15_03055 [Candidatus Aenigmatarchaeota archaeon]|nr:MAG: hypothetical protein DRP15_03055 [Candidatus Aenigmarchaeota archaeon]